MPKSKDLRKTMSGFLDKLITEWGLIIPPGDYEKIVSQDGFVADEFADELLLIQGLIPEYEVEKKRKLRNLFIVQFGGKYLS